MAKTSQELVDIQEQIKRELANTDKTVPPITSRNISTQGKQFTLPDGTVNPGPLTAVILDSRFFNTFYTQAYNANDLKPPVCFAIAKERDEMAPHKEAAEPQNATCEECPMNAWGSDPKGGKGKACRNLIRLAVGPVDATDDTEPMILRIPPTSLGAWGKLVRDLQQLGLIPMQVSTNISFEPSAAFPKLKFTIDKPHDQIQLFWKLRERAQALLDAPATSN